MLTEKEINAYERDGVVIPASYRIAPDRLAALRDAVVDTVEANPEQSSDRLVNAHLDGAAPFGVRGDRRLLELARDEAILDLVEQIIGPDIILWSTHLFCKPPQIGREVPWHQDGHYWPIRPLATCTVWVALDEVSRENGALRVMLGSHREGPFTHHADASPRLALNQVLDAEQLDPQRVRYIELEAGQISLHDVHLVHGSAANTSGRRRAGLAMRYMPSTSLLMRDLDRAESMLDWREMPIFLLRGENRNAGNVLSAAP